MSFLLANKNQVVKDSYLGKWVIRKQFYLKNLKKYYLLLKSMRMCNKKKY